LFPTATTQDHVQQPTKRLRSRALGHRKIHTEKNIRAWPLLRLEPGPFYARTYAK